MYLLNVSEICLSLCCVEVHSRNFLPIYQYVLKEALGNLEQNVI